MSNSYETTSFPGQDFESLLTIGKAARYLGVSIDTLRRWEEKGRVNPLRSPGGHRYFKKADLDNLFGKKYTRDEPTRWSKFIKAEEQFQTTAQPESGPAGEISEALSEKELKQFQPAIAQPISLEKINFDAPPSPPPIFATPTLLQTTAPPTILPKLESILSDEQKGKLAEIIQADRQRKKITIKTKWIIIPLLIFALLDLIFVYIWFSSSAMISPLP